MQQRLLPAENAQRLNCFAKHAGSGSRASSRCAIVLKLLNCFYIVSLGSHSLCMQQHIASKKHKEKQLEWEDLLAEIAASCEDSGGKSVEDDDEGQSNPANSILVS
jgi:hypothetical protein